MTPRDRILARLRGAAPRAAGESPRPLEDRVLFCDYPEGPSDLPGLFERRLEALRGELLRVPAEADAARALRRLLDEPGGGSAVAHRSPLLEAVLREDPELARRVSVDAPLSADSPAFARHAVGISTARALVARTGSVLLDSATAGGRRLTVLPPLHVVLAVVGDLVPSLEEALGRLGDEAAGAPDWSQAVLITGPSRTADIEKILVLGAHGPRRLAVILIDPGAPLARPPRK